MGPVLIVVAVVALIVGIAVVAHRIEQKRIAAMGEAARVMGFTFQEKLDAAALEGVVGELPLFQRGHSRKATSVMTGETAAQRAVVMDYRYVTGSGKNSHTHNQTVVVFPDGGRDLPDFEAGPENVLHRLGQVFGYQDIDFEQDEEFSKRVLLRGEDEAAVRRVFTPDARALLAGEERWSAQARGGKLAVFRAGKRCDPAAVPSHLATALRLHTALNRG
jgi:hypothetical protein